MGKRKKELSEEELFLKECKEDEELYLVVKCKKCKEIHEILEYLGQQEDKRGVRGLKCSCREILIDNYKVNKTAAILYRKER